MPNAERPSLLASGALRIAKQNQPSEPIDMLVKAIDIGILQAADKGKTFVNLNILMGSEPISPAQLKGVLAYYQNLGYSFTDEEGRPGIAYIRWDMPLA